MEVEVEEGDAVVETAGVAEATTVVLASAVAPALAVAFSATAAADGVEFAAAGAAVVLALAAAALVSAPAVLFSVTFAAAVVVLIRGGCRKGPSSDSAEASSASAVAGSTAAGASRKCFASAADSLRREAWPTAYAGTPAHTNSNVTSEVSGARSPCSLSSTYSYLTDTNGPGMRGG